MASTQNQVQVVEVVARVEVEAEVAEVVVVQTL
jgi:hypothetical protein